MVRDWDKWLDEEKRKMAAEDDVKNSRMTDATPMIKEAIEILESGDKVRAKEFVDKIRAGSEKVAKIMIERAESDGTLSFFELEDLLKLGLTRADIGAVLAVLYAAKDGNIPKSAQIAVMTTDYSPLMKHKDIIKKKFNITVLTQEEVQKMQEENKHD